jgi:assimilatory nitrate reductase catalytic subunit
VRVNRTAFTPLRTTCPYCGVGCGLAVSRDGDGWRIAGDPEHPANRGRLCSKGAALGETLGLEERLLHPEIRGRRTSWDEALTTVADGFTRTIAVHGPDSVAFYVSGQLLTEDYYVANKLMKGFIGSANIDTNSRLCMASAVAGHKRAFGADIVPCSYEDIELAELIVIVGSNTAWCHPVLYQRIAARRGGNPKPLVVVIDPRRTATCDIADLHLPIRAGSDVTLFNGLLNWLRREDALDWAFLEAHTEGYADALRTARETAPSIPVVAAACGVPESDIARFYRWFARTPRALTLFSQGVNQSDSGTDKVNAIINVHLATGRIGKPGAGPFSLTGQPNAMGGREVGGLANQLAAHMDFTDEDVDRVGRFWHAPAVARAPGLKAVDLFDAIGRGEIRALWIMATNPAVSLPDAEHVRRALRTCELVVVSDCVRRTDTTDCADVLLPAAAWGEKSGTVTNSERRISRQRAFLPPPGESRPDWWMVTQIARRMGFGDAFAYRGPAEIFREHARLSAFENDSSRAFDIGALAEIDDEAYEHLTPVRWPLRAGASVEPCVDSRFFTPSGRAVFVATPPSGPIVEPQTGVEPPTGSDRPAPLILNTGRVRDQWHTMTRTGTSARLSRHHVEPFVQVNPRDAREASLRHGELAELRGRGARFIARVEVTRDVRPGELFAPMHWNARFASFGRVGALIEARVDPVSGQPALKQGAVTLHPFRPVWHGFVLSREPIDTHAYAYWARAKGDGYWRYELAGDALPNAWPNWARALTGGDEWIELSDRAAGRYRGACLAGGRLRLCVFVAPAAALPGREWLGSLFAADALDDGARRSLLFGRAAGRGADPGPVVCSCFSVGRNTLVRAIRDQLLVSAEQIGNVLHAGTNCGSCVPELNALVAEARAEVGAA